MYILYVDFLCLQKNYRTIGSSDDRGSPRARSTPSSPYYQVGNLSQTSAQKWQSSRVRKRSRKHNKIHPDTERKASDPDLLELEKHGIDVSVVEDEEDKWKILQTIKGLPCSLSTKRRFRDKLSEAPAKRNTGCCGDTKQTNRRFKAWRKEMGYKLELWGSALKKIEGHQGTGVVSYFVFLRWLFFLNIAIFVLMFLFVVIPYLAFGSLGYTSEVIGDGSVSGVDISKEGTCSPLYTVNVSSSASTLIQDFLQGSGWMEKTALFMGFYDAQDLYIGSTSSNYILPLAYFIVTLIVLLLSLITMARYTVGSFHEEIEDQNDHTQYSNKVFGAWDFALSEEGPAQLKKQSLYNDIIGELREQKYMEERNNMSSQKKCGLYTIRVLIFILVLALLGGSGAAIYFVTAYTSDFLSSGKSQTEDNFVVLLVEFLPSLTITALNAVIPIIFGLVIKAEDYTPAFTIQYTLIRTVFLRLASLAVLVATLYQTISCTDKDTQCNVGQGSCDSYRCWETYVGQNFYKLAVLNALVHIAVTLAYELPRKLLTTKCSCGICQKIGPAEFDIPKNVLDLVYTQALCWIGFFYAPLLPILTVADLFFLFYLKYLSAMYNTTPPERPYKASKSNNFFMIVLMVTFFFCCVPVGYPMVSLEPSKGCGPFRIYTKMSVIVDATISNFPSTIRTILSLVTSASVIICLVVLLCLIIYYCAARSSAKSKAVNLMKEQLILEGKDKQFLLNRIYELTGEKPGAKKVTNGNVKTTASTIDETKKGYPDENGVSYQMSTIIIN
ncbi:hypothetical protein FSP39_002448 [Pinctada imbricata]|uniref:TMC domain-containing protein n=1 Tax=Pinctada imbricata TaxID=66713 RepID=A0AA89C091_PINIB|nr:hypothetical protein FSP39_002448 [Pinctada imbricata]